MGIRLMRNSVFAFLVLSLACCKGKQGLSSNRMSTNTEPNFTCALLKLPKTTNYRNEIKELAKIYKDTVIQMESEEVNGVIFKSVLELKPASCFLWLIEESREKKDSVLIQALSNSKSVETYFDLERCELENIVVEFHSNGDPKIEFTTIINFRK